jgi:hypothetical protein
VKTLVGLVLAVLATLGVLGLAELTQNRPDPVEAGTSTEVVYVVATRDYQRGDDAAAQALWALCSSTVGGDVTIPVASSAPDGSGAYSVTISPAIGENGRKRLTGCIEDATLDRVIGHVRSLDTID